jgi:Spy/CpxP family protein refolding chaperone
MSLVQPHTPEVFRCNFLKKLSPRAGLKVWPGFISKARRNGLTIKKAMRRSKMQRTSKVSLILLTLVLALGLAGTAWAQPKGKGLGRGPGRMNLTKEQAGKLFDLKEKFHTDTAGLRKNMMLQRLEMRNLWRAATPDEKAILAKQKEMNSLRDQLMEKMVTFRLEARKIAPNFRFGMGHGFGMGRGFGMGHGFGRGHGGWGRGHGGWGMGPCFGAGGGTPPCLTPVAPPAAK